MQKTATTTLEEFPTAEPLTMTKGLKETAFSEFGVDVAKFMSKTKF